jgi:hypothetical protein
MAYEQFDAHYAAMTSKISYISERRHDEFLPFLEPHSSGLTEVAASSFHKTSSLKKPMAYGELHIIRIKHILPSSLVPHIALPSGCTH